MKSFVVALAMLVAVCAGETYTTENDNFDIQAVVSDENKLKAFTYCFLDKGDCNAVEAHFKKDMPEAIKESCAKCTDAQKQIFKIFVDGLKKHPALYEEYTKFFDPEGKFFPTLLKNIGSA